MAGSKSDAYELDVLAWNTNQTRSGSVFGNTARIQDATSDTSSPYMALFTAPPSSPTDASTFTEVSGGGYARQGTSGKWAAPSAGSVSTNADVTFGPSSASWGTVTAWALMDKATGGRMLYFSDLRDGGGSPVTKAVGNGDSLTFPSGQVTITED